MSGDIGYTGGGGGTSTISYDPSTSVVNPNGFDPNNPISDGYAPAASDSYNDDYFAKYPNAANPYDKTFTVTLPVITYQLVGYDNFGMPIMKPVQGFIQRTYDNPAYGDFENKITAYQNNAYASDYIKYSNLIDQYKTGIVSSYNTTTKYPVGQASIDQKIQELSELEAQKERLEFQDEATKFYNRIADTNNSESISTLQNQIDALLNSIFQDQLHQKQIEQALLNKEREWFNVDFNYLTDPYFGRGGDQIPTIRNSNTPVQQQSSGRFFDLFSQGEISDWMAGGTMYDSPRAGDILFNPIGNLNTTVFLGLENQNFSPSLQSVYASPDVFKMFGTMAGDNGFSVLNFGQ